MIEIERKYLIKNLDFLGSVQGSKIVQGYLSKDPERAVRVRISGNSAFLTIKGKSSNSGLSRYEWETEITVEEAQDLLKICLSGVIDKTRYELAHEGQTWVIDIFHRENLGLILAEIELSSEGQEFSTPKWVDKEVTGDPRYYNSYLSSNPFTTW
ncbi:MAG: CYTH domain-containing protein [Nonlabens sp.]